MGAAVSTSVATSVQTAVNTTYQSARNDCSANCNQLISGNVIVLDNTKAGNITFTQRCSADASCYMKNAVDQVVEAFQKSNVEAGAAPALFPGIQVNTSVSSNRQDIVNDLTQIMENLCTANVNQAIRDNIVYATDSTVQNIGFLQEGNASASCVMENAARLKLQMRQEGDTTAKTGSAASLISAIIGLIILIIIIIAVIAAVRKATKDKQQADSMMGGGGMGGGQKQGQQGQQGGGGIQSMLGGMMGGMGGGGGQQGGQQRSGGRSGGGGGKRGR